MRAWLNTDQGEIVLRLLPELAPQHVERFCELSREGFYDGTLFHRVIPDLLVQGGKLVGPPLELPILPAEFSGRTHTPGVVSMARGADKDSARSEFFICQGRASPFLDGEYSVFAEVEEGLEVLDRIAALPGGANDEPKKPARLKQVTLEERP